MTPRTSFTAVTVANVKVRPASAPEAQEIAELHVATALHAYASIFPKEAPPPTVEEMTRTWSTWLTDDAFRVLVAEDSGRLTGVVLGGPDTSEPEFGHLSRLYVDPLRWGEGIGRALYDGCLEHLIGNGYATVTLWVLESNARARAWYERLGWEPTGERKTVFADAGIDDVRYRLQLG
jgi:ribosomal protein S18 acetylase RimI-like enzyme